MEAKEECELYHTRTGNALTFDRGVEVFMALLVSLPVYITTPAAVPTCACTCICKYRAGCMSTWALIVLYTYKMLGVLSASCKSTWALIVLYTYEMLGVHT